MLYTYSVLDINLSLVECPTYDSEQLSEAGTTAIVPFFR